MPKSDFSIYKTLTQAQYRVKTVTALSNDEQTDVRSTVSKFIDLFKGEHL